MDLAHEPRHRQQLQGDTVLANSVLNALAQTQRWQQAMSFMGKEVPFGRVKVWQKWPQKMGDMSNGNVLRSAGLM